ncbi:NAD(P)H-hydrate dehydratase [Terricaulis sp.]|uniref:NAD(P)H-hydrate dehydratase n=1 Tax=Terricaulis sp. TaxID=2768686 RepID=UPI002AC7727F|nr:NAD(P)H-hydrate dehydratase [Terricaulis sp.]MDZ4690290.1 NAD(P)H-hydrate dehydratase [Terricaulis sp.]
MRKIIALDTALLARTPLPPLAADGDKNERGQVLALAGGRAVPGAALLVGRAALRAGAGKVQLGATSDTAIPLGLAMPEARIHSVPATRAGEMARTVSEDVRKAATTSDAVVLGPGMIDEEEAGALALDLLGAKPRAVVLDAGALTGLRAHRPAFAIGEHVVITPHAGELAKLTEWDAQTIKIAPALHAAKAAQAFGAVVILKGAVTHIAACKGPIFRLQNACAGLGTSGSGDVLAGLIGGFMARGADPLTAASWAVSVHARAGRILAERIGEAGFLAREIADAIPEALNDLQHHVLALSL